MSRRPLSDRDVESLLAALEDGDVSEDGLENDSDDDEDDDMFYQNVRTLLADLANEDPMQSNSDTPVEDVVMNTNENPEDDPPLVNDDIRTEQGYNFDKRRLIWKQDNMTFETSKIVHEPSTMDPAIAELDTPYRCFTQFFTEDLLQQIADQTNLYCRQKDPSSSFTVTTGDLKKFIGIPIFMSVQHFPSVRAYWNEKFGYIPIKAVMPVNKWEMIRRFVHFNDNEKHLPVDHPDHDRLHKIRPLIDYLNETFSSIAIDQRLSIDEQMCATKIGHFLKQYMPNKPHKWGYKLFVLCSLMGYAYRFEIYTGQENDREKPAGEPDLGPGACTAYLIWVGRINFDE